MIPDPNPPIGTYSGATIVHYGIKKTAKGDPAPTIKFEVTDGKGGKHGVFWQGSFNGGGRDITIRALMVCGLTDPRQLAKLADGPAACALDVSKKPDVVIEHQVSQDGTKKFARVAWINNPGSAGSFRDAIDSKEAGALLQGMGLEADFMRIAQENGIVQGGQGRAAPAATADKLDDIPF